MRFGRGSQVAVAVLGSVLVSGALTGCTPKPCPVDPKDMARIESAVSKSEAAASRAEAAARSAADAAAKAQAAADKAAAIFQHHMHK